MKMLTMSCRKEFWDSHQLSDDSYAISDVDLVRPANSGTPVTENKFLEQILNRRVLLLVHGYNNKRDSVASAFKMIDDKQRNRTKFHHVSVGYIWPGGEGIGEGVFLEAEKLVPEVSERFSRVLQQLDSHAASVDVMGHSLGCGVSLSAYSKLAAEKYALKTIHRQFLMAAAVDRDSIEKGNAYYAGADCGKSCHVFYCPMDGIVGAAGYENIKKRKSLGARGPRITSGRISQEVSKKIHSVNCTNILDGNVHSAYKSTNEIYKYIRKIVYGKKVVRRTNYPVRGDDRR